eukprot:TRINITY_DN502_c0_g1_i1.p1 TRINITY_DN502_c0_g1~~TRINITY_DN502_c0_g1_i1.p1  ORF type:complete len:478 (+),score=155.98 TRINITY_DN502_c0_g1_i1:50-1435(+)
MERAGVSDAESVASKDPAKPRSLVEKIMVPLVFTLFVVLRALDRAFLNRTLKLMGKYGTTLTNLYWPLCVQLMNCFMVGGFFLYKRYHERDPKYTWSWLSPVNPNASSIGRVPWHWLAIFSLWDQLNAAIQTVSQQYIPAPLQTPLNNTNTLFTALIAYFYLGSRFKQVHYAGCVLIALACFTGVVVELQNHTLPQPTDSKGHSVSIATSTLIMYYVIYVGGVIPVGISNCYKQKKLKSVDLDIMWAQFWSGWWQVLWGMVSYTINWIPYPVPGGHNDGSPKTLGSDISDAWTCFTGENPVPSVTTCDAEPAWVWFAVYLGFNLTYNLLFLWLTKYLSATWASLGNVVCGNLYAVFNQWKLVGGDGYRTMTLEDWLALTYSTVAMWVYNVEDEVHKSGRSVYGVQLASEYDDDISDDHPEKKGLLTDSDRHPSIGAEGSFPAPSANGPSPATSRHHSTEEP